MYAPYTRLVLEIRDVKERLKRREGRVVVALVKESVRGSAEPDLTYGFFWLGNDGTKADIINVTRTGLKIMAQMNTATAFLSELVDGQLKQVTYPAMDPRNVIAHEGMLEHLEAVERSGASFMEIYEDFFDVPQ